MGVLEAGNGQALDDLPGDVTAPLQGHHFTAPLREVLLLQRVEQSRFPKPSLGVLRLGRNEPVDGVHILFAYSVELPGHAAWQRGDVRYPAAGGLLAGRRKAKLGTLADGGSSGKARLLAACLSSSSKSAGMASG